MRLFLIVSENQNELARTLRHQGIRVGEIVAYRPWRAIHPASSQSGDDRLRSVDRQDSGWRPNEPASGGAATPGIL